MIESRHVLCLVLGLMGLAAYIGSEESGGPSDPMLAARERILRDLTLDARLWGKPVDIPVGSDVWIEAKLINRSKRTTHRVVKPGEGSVVWGAREPYIYYTATLDRGDGKPISLPESPRGWLCGNSLSNWVRDGVELRPGVTLSFPSWPALPFDFLTPGEVTVRVHYVYRGGAARGHRSPFPPDQRGIMKDVPTFELVSRPVRFRVVRPLDVRVRVKRTLKVGETYRSSDVFEVELVRQGPQPYELCPSKDRDGGPAAVYIGTVGESVVFGPSGDRGTHYYINRLRLDLGDRVEVFGMGLAGAADDARWHALSPGTVKVRAAFRTNTGSSASPTILSEWAEVRVEP